MRRTRRNWQPWELDVLRVQYPVMLTATIAAIFDRPAAHIYAMAQRLGVKKSAEFQPHTRKPIGTEKVDSDGYLRRKLTDTGYPPKDWVAVHRINWEAAHGPIPKGHMVIFRDGDKTNVAVENLELISFREQMRRNTLHNYPKEIAQAIQLRGALIRRINRINRATRTP